MDKSVTYTIFHDDGTWWLECGRRGLGLAKIVNRDLTRVNLFAMLSKQEIGCPDPPEPKGHRYRESTETMSAKQGQPRRT